jgi:hypothetical protein
VSGFQIRSYAGPGHLKTGPFETRTQKSGFRMVASLDRFIKKRVIKNNLFMPKRSRLVRKNIRSGLQMVSAILFLPFESRTYLSGPDHLIAGPFESRTQKVSERLPFECRIVRLLDVYCRLEKKATLNLPSVGPVPVEKKSKSSGTRNVSPILSK